MNLKLFDWYIISINIIGFVGLFINNFLYSHTSEGQIDSLLTIITIIGGAPGITLALILSKDHPEKDDMMSRVFVYSICVIQIIILLYYKGFHKEEIDLRVLTFFAEHKVLLIYLIIINIVTFAAYAMDKIAAYEHRGRTRILTLLGIAFIGGSIGAISAMYLFKHKTRKDYFVIGLPLIIIMQVVAIFYFMNI